MPTSKKIQSTGKNKKISVRQPVIKGRMYVAATFNNTLITFTDEGGKAIASSSTGLVGFGGSRKATPYAATVAIEQAVNLAKSRGVKQIEVYIKGPGPGRDAALRVLRGSGLKISLIADVTPIPHNGCRPKKQRRV